MNNRLFCLLALACFFIGVKGQPTVKGNDIIYTDGESAMRISVCTPTMLRITKTTDGQMPENEKWMVEKYDFAPVDFTVNGNDIKTSRLGIHVEAKPWRITVSDNVGKKLYREIASVTRTDTVVNVVAMNPNEHFFGFGERMDHLDQLGQRIHLNVGLGRGVKPAVGGKDILRANYCPVPLMLSNKGYGVFFHTAMPNDWDMGWTAPEQYSFSTSGSFNDYYYIYGPQIEHILQQYQSLTGQSPMMPRAAYGLHIGSYSGGTWGHESETSDTYVRQLIDRLRGEGIPFDLLWLDSTWRNFTSLGNGGCSFEFQDSFTDPKGMVNYATKNHVAMFGLHIRSLLDNGKYNTLLDQARSLSYTIDDGHSNAIVNFFDPKAVDWWWRNAAKRVTDLGVKFFKTDVGSALRFADATPEHQQLHNLFPIAYAKAPYELFGKLNHQRGFDHTREGYAGIQRYPFIWAGDWGSEWQWFEPVVRGGLNIGLSGVGNWSHCMGGFEQYSAYDTDLYLRWCQMGMFSPAAMLFGMDHPRYHAPWTYGTEAERIFIKYDSLRYTLLPYIYTEAWNMYRTSRPIMAPLLYDHTSDVLTYELSDQYMFGRSIMVCPVTVKNALSRPVYFPSGDWVDFWTGERINGRQNKSFLTPIDVMPLFLRRGAIIPQQEAQQWIGEKIGGTVSLLVYPSERSSYDLYEDDGITNDYKQGIYTTTRIESHLADGCWTLTIDRPTGKYKVAAHRYAVNAYLDFKPTRIEVNGHELSGWTYDDDLRLLHVDTGTTNDKPIILIAE